MNTVELLAPAGSPEALDAAIGEGADAVYLGLKDFNARMRSANFTYGQFEGALRSVHRSGKKVYVTVNTVFEQREADRMYQLLKYLSQQGPDAIIVQDFGVVEMARSEFPSLRLHASTQMNIASAKGANALSRHGVSRVVLARELSLNEIKSIKKETNLELEVFVHGALCISVSGICLFSSYLGGKSANRGMCTQACRRLYSRRSFRHQRTDMPDGESGYYFSPGDLQLLEHTPELSEAGVKALKIEGRMKSASYVGAVVSAYRLVIDTLAGGNEEEIRQNIKKGHEILRNDFARPKTTYMFLRDMRAGREENEEQNDNITANEELSEGQKTKYSFRREKSNIIDWLHPEQDGGTGISLGTILKVRGSGGDRGVLVTAPPGLKLSARDSVRIHFNDDSGRISHKLTFAEPKKSSEGEHPRFAAANDFWISSPEGQTGDHVYLIQTKEMRKRYAPVIVHNGGGKGPGREKAPVPEIILKKPEHQTEFFPEGLYVSVQRPGDFYIVQSTRPRMVILPLSGENAEHLLADNIQPLPFKPAEIILSLEPFFPQNASSLCEVPRTGHKNYTITDAIGQLIERGYHRYIVNNPGHFSLFRGYDSIKLIAGPWLYMFNSWALSFISSYGAEGFISPLENNRQNLERTLNTFNAVSRYAEKRGKKRQGKNRASSLLHSMFFITVFAWPPLFSIREDIGSILDFNTFADNMDENFRLVTGNEGSYVYPEKYFSIIDKIPFLKEAGFGRFIIDLRGHPLKKSNYRDLMQSVNENNGYSVRTLPDSGRFNWKDGFYKSGQM